MAKESWKKLALQLEGLLDPNCTLCPLHEETEKVCIIGNPPTKKTSVTLPNGKPGKGTLVIVGEAPGSNEECISGAAGDLLWNKLKEVGLERRNFLVTNAVRCRPRENRTPTAREVKTCTQSYLEGELSAVRPSFGLALGNSGLRAVLGRTGITKYNAKRTEAYGITWVTGFHPAAVLRNPRYADGFHAAVLSFARLVRDEQGLPILRPINVNTRDLLKALIADLKKARWASIDVETWSPHPKVGSRFPGGGLAWWDPELKLVSLNISMVPGRAYVVLLHNKDAVWKNPDRVIEILKPHIMRPGIKWVMQNGKFDEKILQAGYGIRIKQSFDTMGAQYAIDENSLKDLGLLSQVYLGADDYKDMVDKSDLINADGPALVEYGARDGDYTLRLRPVMRHKLKADPLAYNLYTRLLMPAANVLSDIEMVGVPIHRGKFEKRRAKTEKEIEKRLKKFEGVNPRSPQQLAALLYEDLGLPVVKYTPRGKPSTDEDSLVQLGDHDTTGVVDAILEFRHWDGYRSRYFNNWSGFMGRTSDHRLHPEYKLFHTVTGRLSASNPNIQQVPRDTFIRGIVGGRRGWTLVEADYSQIELRIVAHITQDPAMLRAYHTGRDIHLETAMAITGLPESQITSEIRKKAKSVNFGFVYGMGWRKFVQYSKTNYGLDISEGEAQQTRKVFFDTFRTLRGWHERQRRVARDRKYVLSAIGRKRRLWDVDSSVEGIRQEAERQAINSPVQSLASDLMLMSMIKLHSSLPATQARIIATVHDSILFEIRDEAIDQILPLIKTTMEDLPLEEEWDLFFTVPLEVEIKTGKFWSEGAKAVNLT